MRPRLLSGFRPVLSTRFMAGALVAFVAASALAVGAVVPPANAQVLSGVIAPEVPGAFNVLPSTVTAGTKVAASSSEALTITLQKHLYDPKFWAAVEADKAAIATNAEKALVATMKAEQAIPAIKPIELIKPGIGATAGVAVSGLMVGMALGNGTARVLGFKDDMVCSQNNGVLTVISSITNGVDCGEWETTKELANRANEDARKTELHPSTCIPGGRCYQYTGKVNIGGGGTVYCMKISGSGPSAQYYAYIVAGESSASAIGAGGEDWNCLALNGNGSARRMTVIETEKSIASWWVMTDEGVESPRAVMGEMVENPKRATRADILGSDGITYKGVPSSPWTEKDPVFVTPPLPIIPDGVIAKEVTIVEQGENVPEVVLGKAPTTPEYQTQMELYPECSTGLCMLDLIKSGTGSCMATPGPCADWFAEPNKADTYTCKFGGHVVALAECNAYAPTFKPNAKDTGNTIADAETGVAPGAVAPTLADAPLGDNEGPRNCYPTGWGVFNPLSWVYQPVRCVAKDMFVPSKAALNSFRGGVKDRFNASSFGTAARVLAPLNALQVATGNGCSGLPLHLSFFGNSWTGYLFEACSEPMRGVAATIKTIGTVVLIMAGALAALRYIANIVGYAGYGQGSSGGGSESKVSFK